MDPNFGNIKFAVGTDDKLTYSADHFGSAQFFLIYTLNLQTKEIKLQKTIVNKTPEEHRHGDPQKALSISTLLQGIPVLIGRYMGKNITRIRKKFIPIIASFDLIDKSLVILPNIIPEIRSELEKSGGIPKKVLHLRS
ncbi:NifB/NifX family molybdenum-iron cluster-binding protein [Candidatus Lokiarchaeum ossiferum]|uniref:NifB/NifX family molybdenum-iron cluster-binding protein n=1 Tax=Candidatus Lokiarchaeum ossiferum TaxID=2951803 RepID=UPI00352C0787